MLKQFYILEATCKKIRSYKFLYIKKCSIAYQAAAVRDISVMWVQESDKRHFEQICWTTCSSLYSFHFGDIFLHPEDHGNDCGWRRCPSPLAPESSVSAVKLVLSAYPHHPQLPCGEGNTLARVLVEAMSLTESSAIWRSLNNLHFLLYYWC